MLEGRIREGRGDGKGGERGKGKGRGRGSDWEEWGTVELRT